MKTETKSYLITRGQTRIRVPHKDSTLTFVYPKHGPNTYAQVGEAIEQSGLRRPTMGELVSLVHQAYLNEGKEPEFSEIKKIMEDEWLWGFTGILYVPNEGAYVQDHPNIQDGMLSMEKSGLVRKLETHDPTVRFVPFGFKTEIMSALELSRNPFVQALAGEEGAEKLAEIADKHKNKPYIWSFTSVNEPTPKVGTLGSDWDVDDRRLGVSGDHCDDRDGCAFGVRK